MISWFARNSVAANLLMLCVVGLGLYSVFVRLPLLVFPEIELDIVTVSVPFRGATPVESEESIVRRVEEAIFDLDGIEELTGTASEGSGSVSIEIADGYDAREMLDDIKSRVDAISTFPVEAEQPTIQLAERRREVLSMTVQGDLTERQLRDIASRIRDDLTDLPNISIVELAGVRGYEISIEVSAATLDAYNLTIGDISNAISRSSLDLAAGEIRTSNGNFLVRTKGQAYVQQDYEQIPILGRADGTRLLLGDIATVVDGFDDSEIRSEFNGQPAVGLEIFRVGDQSAIDISNTIKNYIANPPAWLPNGVTLNYWRDRAQIVRNRLSTLWSSAWQGGLLIFFVLALFLRFSVAVWVSLGIPIALLGATTLMPEVGASINIISLFAFILVLGVVVDDAIVTGESIYSHQKTNPDPVAAAIEGTQAVSVPVTFGILTTCVAFVPMMFMGGRFGALFGEIAMVVILALMFSLVESKLILPAHMSKIKPMKPVDQQNFLQRAQQRFASGFERGVLRVYAPVLAFALRWRYATWALFLAVLIIMYAVVASGNLRFLFFPRVQSETAHAILVMNPGTPFQVTDGYVRKITDSAEILREKYTDENGVSVITSIMTLSGTSGRTSDSNRGRVSFAIIPPEQRDSDVTSAELVREWRKLIGEVPGAKDLTMRAELFRGGSPVHVRLAGANIDDLNAASKEVVAHFGSYDGVFDITSSRGNGKQEIQIELTPAAATLGVSLQQVAQQVRAAFFGQEAQRIQRGRDDVRVMVRFPEAKRQTLESIEQLKIRTSDGVEVAISEVATLSFSRGDDQISRKNRNRVIDIEGDANKETANIEAIKAGLIAFNADLMSRYPSIRATLEGEAAEQRDTFGSFFIGLIAVLFVIYGLLAIPFKSYSQPLIVMSVIPFGVIGALLGHMIVGIDLAIMSVTGMLALTGVVVNDSLVLVDYVNQQRAKGIEIADAVRKAGAARFRAVILTSLTTFVGVGPLLLDETTQAQILIPMATSLGFGVLFATTITLFLIPVNYLILNDLKQLMSGSSASNPKPAV